ncbi:MAG: hypothetical protein KF883_10100 [Thermomicrobiales bacterium]|nr:hypothetical protein [Thermomicrobiales bacterium]
MRRPETSPIPTPTVDLGYPTEQHGKIPAFNNIEEEAEFWDTHSFVDFLDDSWAVDNPIDPELRKEHRLTVRLSASDNREIEARAKSRGIGSSTLVRMWIRERLDQERKAS